MKRTVRINGDFLQIRGYELRICKPFVKWFCEAYPKGVASERQLYKAIPVAAWLLFAIRELAGAEGREWAWDVGDWHLGTWRSKERDPESCKLLRKVFPYELFDALFKPSIVWRLLSDVRWSQE